MSSYYFVEPEVAGGFGERSEIDRSSGTMMVKKLHYVFEGWLGDELLENTPCFIISERLANEIGANHLTGARFDEVEVTTSDEFKELYPTRQVPLFIWLRVYGVPGQDDFGLAPGLKLVISSRALHLLRGVGLAHAASISPFVET